MTNVDTITPADQGIIQNAIETGIEKGYGDDGIIDEVAMALTCEANWSETAADEHAVVAVSRYFKGE